MLDYIEEYKDFDVIQSPFNIVDALVLTYIIYLPQKNEYYKQYTKGVSYDTFVNNFLKHKETLKKRCVLEKQDLKFANLLQKTKRFGTMKILNYVNIVDGKKEEQFCAATFLTIKGNIFVTFCGTDITLVAWKENLNMSFEKATNAQKSAAKYLNNVAKKFPKVKIYVGGHSKGGNLAMYAATFSNEKVNKRICGIYNFDGPGFPKEIIENQKYQKTRSRIVSIVPYKSLVGMVFEHSDKIKIVYSNGIGILQHNAYTWKVENVDFIYEQKLSKASMRSHYIIRNLINSMSLDERKLLVSTIYKLATTNNAKTTKDWGNNIITILKTIAIKYRTLSSEQKELFSKMFKQLTYGFIHHKQIKNYQEIESVSEKHEDSHNNNK